MKFFDKYKKSIGHFVKFMIVGAINFGVDAGIGALLYKVVGLPLLFANTVSYSCGVINSFFLNRYWTFKQKLKFLSLDFVKFVAVNLVSLGINNLAMYILEDLYGMDYIIAKILATGFSFIVNFAGSKLLVFKENGAKAAEDAEQDNEVK